MRKLIVIVMILISNSVLFAQLFNIVEVDSSEYPKVKVKFLIIDTLGKQVLNLSQSDFEIYENNESKEILSMKCPEPEPHTPISSVLVMDASGSMRGNNVVVARAAAKAWIMALDLTSSECAITAFDDKNYLIQDFSTDKENLLEKTNAMFANGGTNYNAALIDTMAGGLQITKNAKYKPIIVFLTDGQPNANPDIDKIVEEAKKQKTIIYIVTVNMPCISTVREIAEKTGGHWYEEVKSENEAKQIYQLLLNIAQGAKPCEIEWFVDKYCDAKRINVKIKNKPMNLSKDFYFFPKSDYILKINFEPKSIILLDPLPGTTIDTTIRITARNSAFKVTNITSSNDNFSISPTAFDLKSDESIDLKISYFVSDSAYYFNKFIFENDICPTHFYMSAGWRGKKSIEKTIHLLNPDGNEIFVAGSDTLITWEGIMPEEKVRLEYSSDKGNNWNLITDTADSLSYNWKVPYIESSQCLARVSSRTSYKDCNNPDTDLCGKIWMSCNLNVIRYRNGDTIPEVTDPIEWMNTRNGAWCYYNNDPSTEIVYGKLYNWYAVNDSRGLAPEGWHIPSHEEWIELSDCLGGPNIAGGKLKLSGTIEDSTGVWRKPNSFANNESSFFAYPGGWRGNYGDFYMKGYNASWWTSTEYNKSEAILKKVNSNESKLVTSQNSKCDGYSIRCVRD